MDDKHFEEVLPLQYKVLYVEQKKKKEIHKRDNIPEVEE